MPSQGLLAGRLMTAAVPFVSRLGVMSVRLGIGVMRLGRRRLVRRLTVRRLRVWWPRDGGDFPLGLGNQTLEEGRHPVLQCGGRVGASRLESLSQRGFSRLQCSRNDFVYGSHFDLMWVCTFRFNLARSPVGRWRFTPSRRPRRPMRQYLNDAADFSDWGKYPREGFEAQGHETR